MTFDKLSTPAIIKQRPQKGGGEDDGIEAVEEAAVAGQQNEAIANPEKLRMLFSFALFPAVLYF